MIVGLVLNYRDATRTQHCIESMLADGIQHVVVLDNSEDGGKSAVSLQQRTGDPERVMIDISSRNIGFAAGVNRGMGFISRHFGEARVLLLNNDACLLPGAVQALSKALIQHPAAAVAFPDIDHAGRVLGPVYYQRYTGILSGRPIPGSFRYASGCCQLIDPARLRAALFDEDFFMYGEDWIEGWTLGSNRMVHVPETLVFHEGSRGSGLGSQFYENHLVAAHWIAARKLSCHLAEVPLLYLVRAASLSARAILRSIRHRSMVPLRALYFGWRKASHGRRSSSYFSNSR